MAQSFIWETIVQSVLFIDYIKAFIDPFTHHTWTESHTCARHYCSTGDTIWQPRLSPKLTFSIGERPEEINSVAGDAKCYEEEREG